MLRCLLFIFALLLSAPAFAVSDKPSDIPWQKWSPAVFETAKQEKKLVFLEVGAVWCHWCHVMEQTTYRDAAVINLMKQNYIPVQVDQDAQPDLSQRYEEYGWPAVVIFDADGKELIKHRGYINPKEMVELLEETYRNPQVMLDAGISSVSATGELTTAQRDFILTSIVYAYDKKYAGWGSNQKFLGVETITLALKKAEENNRRFGYMAKQTLAASYNLIDPVWGGVYQYSDEIDWKSPHFEKILSFHSDYIQSYAAAYALFDDPLLLKAARDVLRYVDAFLTSPDGAFYTSQDADLSEKVNGHTYYALGDQERRKLGLPRIDTNIYSNENGRMISALAKLYAVTGEKDILDRAFKTLGWIKANRGLGGGGFAHGEDRKAGLFITDSLLMARGSLDLYAVTGDRALLAAAEESGKFIYDKFHDPQGAGFFTHIEETPGVLDPFKHLDNNIFAARFFNQLALYTGKAEYKKYAVSAMRFAASPEQLEERIFTPGTVLANDELATEPLHLVVVGSKNDAQALALFKAAIAVPVLHKQTEWYDKAEGELPNSLVDYPELAKPAAFICTAGTCSAPIYEASEVKGAAEKAQAAAVTTLQAHANTSEVATPSVPAAPPAQPAVELLPFWLILAFAFLGGLILNIMPCVLPILALKAFTLVQKAQASRALARQHGLAYTAGVVVSFLLIAAVLLGLRTSGESIGWGFQLQSPAFVGVLFLLIAAATANLAGLYELPTLFGNVETSHENLKGSTLTGMLAVAVATPCTAPFMATAIGATLLLSTAESLLVFASMGFGMAAPFLLISLSPRFLALLPKPGPWMLRFKQFLAIPMALTAIWLGWVFVQLVMPSISSQAQLSGYDIVQAEAYSPARLKQLRDQKKPVFLDATAAWCITCKVNERVALYPSATQDYLKSKNVTVLVADWTSANPVITALLAEFGRNGVPLYVFYPAQGAPVVLPQVLTPKIVMDAIK